MTEKLQWLLCHHYCPDLTGHCFPDRFYNWPLLARDSGKCSFQTSIPHKTGRKTEKEFFMSKHKPPSTKNKNKSEQTNETVSIMTYHPSFFLQRGKSKSTYTAPSEKSLRPLWSMCFSWNEQNSGIIYSDSFQIRIYNLFFQKAKSWGNVYMDAKNNSIQIYYFSCCRHLNVTFTNPQGILIRGMLLHSFLRWEI